MYYAKYEKGRFYQKQGKNGRPFLTPYLKGRGFAAIRARLKKKPGQWIALD